MKMKGVMDAPFIPTPKCDRSVRVGWASMDLDAETAPHRSENETSI